MLAQIHIDPWYPIWVANNANPLGLLMALQRKRTGTGLDFDDGLERKDIGAAASKDQREHNSYSYPLRNRLDEHAPSQGHSTAEERTVVVDSVHLGLFEGRGGIDDAGRRFRRNGSSVVAVLVGVYRIVLRFRRLTPT